MQDEKSEMSPEQVEEAAEEQDKDAGKSFLAAAQARAERRSQGE